MIVRFQEDLSQTRLADRVIFQIELVKAVERVLVRMHIKGVDGKVVRRKAEGFEHLLQGKFFPVTDNYGVLRAESVSVPQR